MSQIILALNIKLNCFDCILFEAKSQSSVCLPVTDFRREEWLICYDKRPRKFYEKLTIIIPLVPHNYMVTVDCEAHGGAGVSVDIIKMCDSSSERTPGEKAYTYFVTIAAEIIIILLQPYQ